MSYMWQDFNIKTFPAETIVFRDGVFCPEISTLNSLIIDKHYSLPVHLIYVGEIAGENNLYLDVLVPNQNVFITIKVKNKKPAFLNIFIKNAGKNSVVKSQITVFNESELNFGLSAGHFDKNTGIFVYTKIIGMRDSITNVSETANIYKQCENCDSDINISALLEEGAKLTFTPAQKIASVPNDAKHGAALYAPKDIQIEYLRQAGLSGAEVKDALREAFIENSPLF